MKARRLLAGLGLAGVLSAVAFSKIDEGCDENPQAIITGKNPRMPKSSKKDSERIAGRSRKAVNTLLFDDDHEEDHEASLENVVQQIATIRQACRRERMGALIADGPRLVADTSLQISAMAESTECARHVLDEGSSHNCYEYENEEEEEVCIQERNRMMEEALEKCQQQTTGGDRNYKNSFDDLDDCEEREAEAVDEDWGDLQNQILAHHREVLESISIKWDLDDDEPDFDSNNTDFALLAS